MKCLYYGEREESTPQSACLRKVIGYLNKVPLCELHFERGLARIGEILKGLLRGHVIAD